MSTTNTTEVYQEVPEAEETDYPKREQAHYQEICEQEKVVRKLADKAEMTKDQAKAAKTAYEQAASELHDLIRRGPDPQQKLPGMEDVDSDWRKTSLMELAFDVSILKALEEAGVTTVGELADRQADGDDRPLTDITGIGPAKAELITERLGQFWEEHPERKEMT